MGFYLIWSEEPYLLKTQQILEELGAIRKSNRNSSRDVCSP